MCDIIQNCQALEAMDETALIKSAKKGDVDAFNRLVLTYQEQAYNLALRMLHDDTSAQDATQISFISAWEKIHTFHGGSFRAWMLRIVTNNCYDELRRWKRKPTADLNPTDGDSGEEIEDPEWLTDSGDSPEERLARKELEEAIQRCIDHLPEEFRAVVILVDVQGLDYQTASDVVKSPLGTIRSRLARARHRLQDCLQGVRELLPAEFRFNSESRL